MKFSIPKDLNALTRAFTRVWLLLKNNRERKKIERSERLTIEVITKMNIMAIVLMVAWAVFYFSFQYVFTETPRYFYGPLFTIAPTLFIQQFRHIVIDNFATYFYVYGLGGMYAIFFIVGFGSERNMWKFFLAFLACWMMQGTLQLLVGCASPIRMPGTEVDFIRYEVFPASEAVMGIKYGAIPSGHIGAPIILFLTGRLRKLKWVQWVAIGVFLAFAFIVVYLGEHYIIDGVISLIIYPIMFMSVWKLSNKLDRSLQAKKKGKKHGIQ